MDDARFGDAASLIYISVNFPRLLASSFPHFLTSSLILYILTLFFFFFSPPPRVIVFLEINCVKGLFSCL